MVGFVKRHRFRILDFSTVILCGLAVGYAGLVYDVFSNVDDAAHEDLTLELDELVAASVVFFGGMAWAFSRLSRERRENARRIAAEHEIRHLAFHDSLTGLPNRRQFDEALRAAVGAPPHLGASHGVLMLDLNGFKRVNDVFGHSAGDEVLMQIGARMVKAVRAHDLVARFGGDEFAVLATHISGPEAATGLALRIIEELQSVIETARGKHMVGAAIGIALMPQNGTDPAELLRKADIALYRAKTQGKSAMRFFEEEMDVRVRERHQIECDLRVAIENKTLVPFYQPQVDMQSGEVRGFEILPQWTHSMAGEIGADRFIPIAEDCGLIGPLTDVLLARACADARSWPERIGIAFNLSPVLLHDPAFGANLMALLRAAEFPFHRLELGITESALVRDMGAAQVALTALREAGVQIALDNFGTGYSSLYHLRNFKVDRIKIDSMFIHSMTDDRDSAAIVKALVGLGVGLGLEVIAEGVETEEQKRFLLGQGCKQGWGRLYSQALDAAGVGAFFDEDDPVFH